MMMSRLAFLPLVACLAACGAAVPPVGPEPPAGHWQGDASAINPAQKSIMVQLGRVSAATVRVTSATRFFGVSGFDEMVGQYAAGTRMFVDVTTDSASSVDGNAVIITVQEKSGPFPVHFSQPATLNTWVGLLALSLPGDPRGAVLVLPWTRMRPDSEFASPGDIRNALLANRTLCVAGDGFVMGVSTTEALTIGAWQYTGGDPFAACQDK